MTLLEHDLDDQTDTGEPDCAHYVRKDAVTEAYILGTPLEALCGVLFVPHRDPERYPVCQACAEILKGLRG